MLITNLPAPERPIYFLTNAEYADQLHAAQSVPADSHNSPRSYDGHEVMALVWIVFILGVVVGALFGRRRKD